MIKQSEKGKISKIISTFAEKIGKATMVFEYDVLVIGGGHAGCEALLRLPRLAPRPV